MARILVIEDDYDVRMSLRMALEDADYEVEVATNGQIGIDLYKQAPADLIITDILMPEKEGVELISELTNEFADIKIIAISGGGRMDPELYLDISKRLGAIKTFPKPVDIDVLVDAVGELLE